jgi:hypothetical protein
MGQAVDNNLTSNPGAPGFSSRNGNLQDYSGFSYVFYSRTWTGDSRCGQCKWTNPKLEKSAYKIAEKENMSGL